MNKPSHNYLPDHPESDGVCMVAQTNNKDEVKGEGIYDFDILYAAMTAIRNQIGKKPKHKPFQRDVRSVQIKILSGNKGYNEGVPILLMRVHTPAPEAIFPEEKQTYIALGPVMYSSWEDTPFDKHDRKKAGE